MIRLPAIRLHTITPRSAAVILLGSLATLLAVGSLALFVHGRHAIQTLASQKDQRPMPPPVVMPEQMDQPAPPSWPRREELHASLRQPPFYPDRKLPAAEVQSVSSGDERYRLSGTVVSGQRRFAIIENRTTKETKRLGVGESLDGLTITAVLPDLVVLGQGAQRRELHMTWAPSPTSTPRRTVVATPDRKAVAKPKTRQLIQDQRRIRTNQAPSSSRGLRR